MRTREIDTLNKLIDSVVRLNSNLTRKTRDLNLTLDASEIGEPMTGQEINVLATMCGSLRRTSDEIIGQIETVEALLGRALSDLNQAKIKARTEGSES